MWHLSTSPHGLSLSTWLAWASSQHGSLRVARLLTWQLLPRRTILEVADVFKPSLRSYTVLFLVHSVKASLRISLDSKKEDIDTTSW